MLILISSPTAVTVVPPSDNEESITIGGIRFHNTEPFTITCPVLRYPPVVGKAVVPVVSRSSLTSTAAPSAGFALMPE